VSAELDRLETNPYVARLLRSLAEHPPAEATIEEPVRRAAILLALRSRADGEPELLMIKRAEAEGDPWSGHVACPGGRMEPGDRDLAATAIRETWEETGVDLARDGRLLGALDDLSPRTPVLPPLVIRPFVAVVKPEVEIVQSIEVAQAFWVPLSAIRERAAWGTGLVQVRGTSLHVTMFRHGDYVVWGLTERVLRQFVEYVGGE